MFSKIGKPLARLIEEKREKTHVNKIRNERGKVTTGMTDIQRIILGYYERLYATKFNNLEEVDKFLEIYNLPRVNHEELVNLYRLINSEEIETTSHPKPPQR